MKPVRVHLLLDTRFAVTRGMLRGIHAFVAMHAEWDLLLRPMGELHPTRAPDPVSADGVIAHCLLRTEAEALDASAVPWVNVSNVLAPLAHDRWRRVIHDDRAVGAMAARHLIDTGMRHLAVAAYTEMAVYIAERAAGFDAEARKANLPCAWLSRVCGLPTSERIDAHVSAWLESLPRPCGVLAASDEHAVYVIDRARAAGLRVPDDLAVVGADNDEVACAVADVPVSSVTLDAPGVGFTAARVLASAMKDARRDAVAATDGQSHGRVSRARQSPPPDVIRIAPLGVVVRQSSDTVACADADVAAAIRYVRAHAARRDLDVEAVADAVALSRRALERRFARHAGGRTVAAEIRRARLARATALLAATDSPIEAVALRSGFGSREHFAAAFRQVLGTTPGAYRRRFAQ